MPETLEVAETSPPGGHQQLSLTGELNLVEVARAVHGSRPV